MKILVSAYACEPDKGSEPGVGWNWTREIARYHDVWVLTQTKNRTGIEGDLARSPQPRMHFLYVELPRWLAFWKRGQRGIRLYYYLWQFAALREARRAHKEITFDLVHHLTFANIYVPALVCLVPAPFIWGPVGGGVPAPWRLAPDWGVRGVAYEALRAVRRVLGRYLDPLVRLTWRRACVILVQNPETRTWLPPRYRRKAKLCPNTGVDPSQIVRRTQLEGDGLLAVTPARLIHWKGVALALRAIAAAGIPELRLAIAGEGHERPRLERLARRLHIESQVHFLGWLDRPALSRLFSRADVLLFPSQHEEGGMVVVEGMAHGVVPIVLDVGGPSLLVEEAGVRIRPSTLRKTVNALAGALADLADPMRLSEGRQRAAERAAAFTWSRRVHQLLNEAKEVSSSGAGIAAESVTPW